MEFWVLGGKTVELVEETMADFGGDDLRALRSHLRGEEAYPDALDLGTGAPETEKFFHVTGTVRDLAGYGAVDGDAAVFDGVENALIGGGFAALVVLGLQAVD